MKKKKHPNGSIYVTTSQTVTFLSYIQYNIIRTLSDHDRSSVLERELLAHLQKKYDLVAQHGPLKALERPFYVFLPCDTVMHIGLKLEKQCNIGLS